MQNKRNQLLIVAQYYLFFLVLSCTTQLLLALHRITSFEGFKDACLYSSIWLIPVLIVPKYSKKIAAGLGLFLWLFALPSFVYFLLYQQELSQSLLFILFETNQRESLEYLKNYIDIFILFKLLCFTFLPIYLFFCLDNSPRLDKTISLYVTAFIVCIIFLFPIKKGFERHNVHAILPNVIKHASAAPPWQLIIGYGHYQRELKKINHLLTQFDNIASLANLQERSKPMPTTVVLVIGESSSRLHFSLYGYKRETNPRLSSIKSELHIFNQVFASRPNTIESLEQVLSFANQKNPNLYLSKPTLVAMMKQAGYKTIWISNQQSLSSRNTILTSFAQQTDKQIWLNNSRVQNYAYSYDENVLQPFSKELNDPAEKKMIIIHLLGTHMSYKYRYPKTEEYFKTYKDLPEHLSEGKKRRINEYDNAIRYNDKIIFTLINLLKNKNQHSALLYFSDHGEDVYDAGAHDFQGRNEENPTMPMYAIPFLVWTSGNWFNRKMLENPDILSHQFSNAELIHAWSHMLGIRFDGYEESKSIFSEQYQDQAIMVGDPYTHKVLQPLAGTH